MARLGEKELRVVMPSRAEVKALDPEWTRRLWWNFQRQDRQTWARVYLNGNGTDHELRFIVYDKTVRGYLCQVCEGTGVVKRANIARGFLAGIREPRPDDDEVKERNCLTCFGSATSEPKLGASNSFQRTPDIEKFLPVEAIQRRLGVRGLASPNKEEILQVVKWCNEMISRIKAADLGTISRSRR